LGCVHIEFLFGWVRSTHARIRQGTGKAARNNRIMKSEIAAATLAELGWRDFWS
jgi:hypothetical protein